MCVYVFCVSACECVCVCVCVCVGVGVWVCACVCVMCNVTAGMIRTAAKAQENTAKLSLSVHGRIEKGRTETKKGGPLAVTFVTSVCYRTECLHTPL
jgi:hypothetical protein